MNITLQAVESSKQFNASVQELYDAWIKESKLKQWWQPAGNRLKQVENDVKEGGNIRYAFETKNGDPSFVITGQYKQVQPAVKLVYTWNWTMPGSEHFKENHFELTVEFSGDNNSSEIRISQKELDAAEAVHPHQKGWDEELERLAAFLN